MKLTIRTDYNTAAKILSNVYNADKSATYSHKKRNIVGSAISAFIKYDAKGCYVDVQSNYFSVASLKEITGVNKFIKDASKEKEVRRLLNEDQELSE